MILPNGTYKTENGSIVIISGKNSGKTQISFDWFEEKNACIDCEVDLYPVEDMLEWSCKFCGGGSTKLFLVK